MGINNIKCPKCGSQNSIKVVYGYPTIKLMNEAKAGKVMLGGCNIDTEHFIEFHCKDCKNEWASEKTIAMLNNMPRI